MVKAKIPTADELLSKASRSQKKSGSVAWHETLPDDLKQLVTDLAVKSVNGKTTVTRNAIARELYPLIKDYIGDVPASRFVVNFGHFCRKKRDEV